MLHQFHASLAFILIVLIAESRCYDSCLHYRSICLRNTTCHEHLKQFQTVCNYNLKECRGTSPSDCVHSLQSVRSFFPTPTCTCYQSIGFSQQCDQFRQLIWNHPCERLLKDTALEMETIHRRLQSGTNSVHSSRRTTRTPMSDQVHHWKSELSGELLNTRLKQRTCDEALYGLCLKHVSCANLWSLFRRNCDVDKDNQCRMDSRQICWQSFEGLTWTGLGNCQCTSSNSSDCHWIRLHTNYNKCINEIARSGEFQAITSVDHHRMEERLRMTAPANIEKQKEAERLEQLKKKQIQEQQEVLMKIQQLQEQKRKEDENLRQRQMERARNEQQIKQVQRQRYEQEQLLKRLQMQTDELRRAKEREREEVKRHEEILKNLVQRENELKKSRARQEQNEMRRIKEKQEQEELRKLREKQEKEEQRRNQEKQELEKLRRQEVKKQQEDFRKAVNKKEQQDMRRIKDQQHEEKQKKVQLGQQQKEFKNQEDQPIIIKNKLVDDKRQSQPEHERMQLKEKPKPKEPRVMALKLSAHINEHQATRATPIVARFNSTAESSTCLEAIRKCESFDECRWQLGELRVRCSASTCKREECAESIQRFSTYVPFSLVESIMFCHCAPNDSECNTQQEIVYPRCLYQTNGYTQSCTQIATNCESDTRCRKLRSSIITNCPVNSGECTINSLDNCRRSLVEARASSLEQACFCKLSDMRCLQNQHYMIPANPCIENAMSEYSKITGRNTFEKRTQPVQLSQSESTNSNEMRRDGIEKEEIAVEQKVNQVLNQMHYQKSRQQQKVKKLKITTTTTTMKPPTTEATTMTSTEAPEKEVEGTSKKTSFFSFLNIFKGSSDDSKKKKQATAAKTTIEPPQWVPENDQLKPAPIRPVPVDGCTTKDPNGRSIFTPIGTIVRHYVDWSGRCSNWCECVSKDKIECDPLPCFDEGTCDAPLTTLEYGERIYLKQRGACYCEADGFVCEHPSESQNIQPGLYLAIGYSVKDIEMLRKTVPREILDRAGFSSSDSSKDIASQMQIAFDLLLPKTIPCRIVTMSEFNQPGNAIYRIEWYGMNEMFNHTNTQWYSDGSEKICSPYVRKLADHFSLNESPRFQLVLSTVKQVKVVDYLDGIPVSTTRIVNSIFIIFILIYLHIL